MSRGLRYLAAWSASTAAAVALSWLGIRSVLDAGVPERPRFVAGPVQQSSAVPSTTTPTTTTPPPIVTTAPTTTTTTATTTTTTTTAEPPPLPSEEGTWTRQDGEPVYLRSFRLHGGVAAVRFAPRDLQPISATPHQGFAATVEQPADAVVVEFTGAGHRSRLEATWVNGPQWRIIESG
ncbi:hypothetical protein Q5530_08095 [Saccharothrix sp. BKS2]|uniref:hypothetical protein n=1 Tax=Saccharothrix sp. BKS2 TaxID=3064400 RepID=UPI0039EBFF45